MHENVLFNHSVLEDALVKYGQFPQRYKTCLASNGLHSPDDMTFVIQNIHTIHSYCLISFRNLRLYVHFLLLLWISITILKFNEHLFLFHKNKARLKSRNIYKPLFGCSNKQKPQKTFPFKMSWCFRQSHKMNDLKKSPERKDTFHSLYEQQVQWVYNII